MSKEFVTGKPGKGRNTIHIRLSLEIEKDLEAFKKKLEERLGLKLAMNAIVEKLIRIGLNNEDIGKS